MMSPDFFRTRSLDRVKSETPNSRASTGDRTSYSRHCHNTLFSTTSSHVVALFVSTCLLYVIIAAVEPVVIQPRKPSSHLRW